MEGCKTMIHINKIYLLSCVLASSSFVFAQQATNTLERIIIEKALDNFEMYKSCITIADDETKSFFLDLFESDSVSVYNDLLGISTKKSLSISEYLKEQKKNLVSPIIKISNINRGKIWEEDGKYKIQLSFDKSLSFQNPCGIYFNTRDFYGKMFRESMILVYDEELQKCRIESIDGKIDSNRILPDDYCILDSTNMKDRQVIYKHRDGQREKVKFNSFGQMLLTHGHEKDQFVYGDKDVIVKSNYNPDCHLMTLSYKNYHWRIKPHYDFGISQALTISKESFFSNVDSWMNNIGIDAGYVFSSNGPIKYGIFMGLGIANTYIDLLYKNELYSISTNQDIDGDLYYRNYTNLMLSQKTTFRELSIPVYVDFDWRFSPWVSFYVDFGVNLNLNTSKSVDFEGQASNVYGVYPQYNNINLDYHWGRNGFTNSLNLTESALCQSERIIVSEFTPEILLGAGLRVNIPSTPMALELGLGYMSDLKNMISISSDNNIGNYNSNIIYNEMSGENSAEHVHDLLESTSYISRNYLKFNVGLVIKL